MLKEKIIVKRKRLQPMRRRIIAFVVGHSVVGVGVWWQMKGKKGGVARVIEERERE